MGVGWQLNIVSVYIDFTLKINKKQLVLRKNGFLMRFQISWIKQIEGKQENVSLLMNAPSEDVVRDFCAKNSMVLFELKPFEWKKEDFGKIIVKVQFDNALYEIVTPFEKARDSYFFLASAGLRIGYINNFTHMMSDEDVAMVLKKLHVEFAESKKKKSDEKDRSEHKEVRNTVLQKDPELDKMRRIANQAVADMEEVKTKTSWGFSQRKMNDLKDMEEELKKVRMGSNIPKMRSLISDAYKLMEELEMAYLDQQKAAETMLIADSVVTHLDLVREYEKYEKAIKVKKWKLEKTPSDVYYIFFGKPGIYQKFLSKEFGEKFSNRWAIFYKSIDYMVLFIFMCIVWLTVTSLYQHYVLHQEVFYFAFVDFALGGLILIAINKLKRSNPLQILLLFGIWFAIYMGLRYLIISNFAL